MEYKIETDKYFHVLKCMENPDKLYVFGENEEQQDTSIGGGGQAVIRGYENAFGFCTLKAIGDYWIDQNYEQNCAKIEKDIEALKIKAKNYSTIVFPTYGLGTGRAHMNKECPRTFLYMCTALIQEFGYNNLEFIEIPKY